MTTTAHRTPDANVPGASARRMAAQLRAGTSGFDVPAPEVVSRTPAGLPAASRPRSVREALGWAVCVGLFGFFIHYVVALVLAGAVFIVAKMSRRTVKSSAAGTAAGPSRARLTKTPPTPQQLKAADRWEQGARGEEETARILAPLLRDGWTILHDRGLVDSRANLDHIAVGPGGQIVVIDSKKWTPYPGVELKVPYTEDALVYRYDRTKDVRALLNEVDHMVDDIDVRPTALIVVHDVEYWGPRLRCLGVLVIRPDRLLDEVRQAQPVSRRSDLARFMDLTFPPYRDRSEPTIGLQEGLARRKAALRQPTRGGSRRQGR
ncbi:nuclease-related domain-containing protein [Kitasatospora xanthocidica]|uniref:nuclease-related domain-containing protein n=1 Tax=Kitasatospora xanthocidica TaxID=83382 RepID=UPI0016783BB0|nr:nuclease-related domain-containing protein [Kitasatospora xanthocidica]